jgi:hypothetical protein
MAPLHMAHGDSVVYITDCDRHRQVRRPARSSASISPWRIALPLLNAPIVSAAQDGTLVDEHRADGNTALGKSLLSFFNRGE